MASTLLKLSVSKKKDILDVELDGHGGLFITSLKDICIFFRDANNKNNLVSESSGFFEICSNNKIDSVEKWNVGDYYTYYKIEDIPFEDFKFFLEFIIKRFDDYFYLIDISYTQEEGNNIKAMFERVYSKVNQQNYLGLFTNSNNARFQSYYKMFVKHSIPSTQITFKHSGFSYEQIIQVLKNIFSQYQKQNSNPEYVIYFEELYFTTNFR